MPMPKGGEAGNIFKLFALFFIRLGIPFTNWLSHHFD